MSNELREGNWGVGRKREMKKKKDRERKKIEKKKGGIK